jgi:hypothetical protein
VVRFFRDQAIGHNFPDIVLVQFGCLKGTLRDEQVARMRAAICAETGDVEKAEDRDLLRGRYNANAVAGQARISTCKDFLKSLIGGPASESSLKPGDIPFYYMDRSQLDDLYEFRRNLKKSRKLV